MSRRMERIRSTDYAECADKKPPCNLRNPWITPGTAPSLSGALLFALKLKLNRGPRTGLHVVDLHLRQLVPTGHLFEALGEKLFQQPAFVVVGLGLDDAAAFVVDPRSHHRITAGRGLRIHALEDFAKPAAVHFLFHQPLRRPVEE